MTANTTDPIPCPMCGSENAAHSAFCSVCGYNFRGTEDNTGGQKCARCGSQVPGGYDFCPVCGLDQRRRLSRPSTQIVSIDGAGQAEGEATNPQAPATPPSANPPLSQSPTPSPAGPNPSLTVPAPGLQGGGPPVLAPPASPGPAPAQTGRTMFVEGPPLPRPPSVGEDDKTIPAPGRRSTAAPTPVSPFVPVQGGGDPGPAPHLPSRDLEAELSRPTDDVGGVGGSSPSSGAPPSSAATLGGREGEAPEYVSTPSTPPSAVPTAQAAAGVRIVLVARDGEERESFPFTGEAMTFGRDRGDIVFHDDAFMSPEHARVERSGSSFTLADIGSTNGVYLRIRGSAPVYPGDLFMVGHQVLRLDNVSESVQEQPPGPDGTRLFGTPLKPAWGKLVLVGRGGVPGNVYYLRGAKVVFGREQGDILVPHDPFVSREHARLRLELQGSTMAVFLEDLGSANGTYIRIRGSVEVRGRDTFRIGDQILRLRLDR